METLLHCELVALSGQKGMERLPTRLLHDWSHPQQEPSLLWNPLHRRSQVLLYDRNRCTQTHRRQTPQTQGSPQARQLVEACRTQGQLVALSGPTRVLSCSPQPGNDRHLEERLRCPSLH
jgi:hypothetical protein